MKADVVLVVPVGDLVDHDEAGLDCWCSPTYRETCECDGGCWKCERGVIVVDRQRAVDILAAGARIIVVHNAVDGSE